jgi:hypothetical protein
LTQSGHNDAGLILLRPRNLTKAETNRQYADEFNRVRKRYSLSCLRTRSSLRIVLHGELRGFYRSRLAGKRDLFKSLIEVFLIPMDLKRPLKFERICERVSGGTRETESQSGLLCGEDVRSTAAANSNFIPTFYLLVRNTVITPDSFASFVSACITRHGSVFSRNWLGFKLPLMSAGAHSL